MILAALCLWLQSEGLGIIGKNLFWEKLPLQNNGKPSEGIWLTSRGGEYGTASDNNLNRSLQFDITSSYADQIVTEKKLRAVIKALDGQIWCSLDCQPEDDTTFNNVTCKISGAVTNGGVSANGNISKIASGVIKFDYAGGS